MLNREKIIENLKDVKNKVVIMSGKGGVGKSTISTYLGLSLSKEKKRVGLLDCDFHGPTIPKLLGIERFKPEVLGDKILPIEFDEYFRVLSIAFFLQSTEDAVIWRGPLKIGAIRQFLEEVHWGNLDFLLFDLPPGTGDEPLTIAQLIPPPVHCIIVTTPQEVALTSVRKSINFAKKLKMNILGIVENMSGLTCPHCGKDIPFFKKGGGEKCAMDLKIPYLGGIPFDLDLMSSSDSGKPIFYLSEDKKAKAPIMEIGKKIQNIL
ncbi:MAG: Mrp/NBP35 family ATP-binding protein [Thermoanaerobaculia bacterium]